MSSIPGYVTEPQTHRVNNTGTSTFRLIGISNGSAGGAGVADETPGLGGEREIANDYFRGYRHTLAAGDCLAMQLDQPIVFHNPQAVVARYLVAIVSEPVAMPTRPRSAP